MRVVASRDSFSLLRLLGASALKIYIYIIYIHIYVYMGGHIPVITRFCTRASIWFGLASQKSKTF
jgi:hypothetical protein